MDARLGAERPDAVASQRTSAARMLAGVMGWTAATQLANRHGRSECDTLLDIIVHMVYITVKRPSNQHRSRVFEKNVLLCFVILYFNIVK